MTHVYQVILSSMLQVLLMRTYCLRLFVVLQALNVVASEVMTIRLGTHLSPTISSDAATLHVCKQQQIASGNKYY